MQTANLPGLVLTAALGTVLFLSCRSAGVVDTGPKTPGPPIFDSLRVTTVDDTVPCTALYFRDTNELTVSLSVIRGGPFSEGFETIVRRIPAGNTVYYDKGLFAELSFFQDTDEYRYALQAVTPTDSLSPASDTDTLLLFRHPPEIDKIDLEMGYPAVTYTLVGQRGLDLEIQIVKYDSVLAGFTQTDILEEGTYRRHFTGLSLDSLVQWADRDSMHNGTYGVRLLAYQGNAVGIGTGKFNVYAP